MLVFDFYFDLFVEFIVCYLIKECIVSWLFYLNGNMGEFVD